mgnify:CR=1 FL=1
MCVADDAVAARQDGAWIEMGQRAGQSRQITVATGQRQTGCLCQTSAQVVDLDEGSVRGWSCLLQAMRQLAQSGAGLLASLLAEHIVSPLQLLQTLVQGGQVLCRRLQTACQPVDVLAAAVENATGLRITRMPLSPSELYHLRREDDTT